MKSLSPAQRQHLKGLAHGLQPVVMIGNQGLTPAVLKEIERSLAAHELIKVKAASDEIETRRAWMEEICTATGAAPVQQIGKVLVLYRAGEKPVIALPK
ncbi:MAG: ribosome assembly RNA-binding protein YhbY [Thiobacillus sp.]|nr:ribosome assembly RNA-binding protein YhbY [Thiobacillus sp.]